MAKPIFIAELPDTISEDEYKLIKDSLYLTLTDYHIIITTGNKTKMKFKVLSEKDFTHINYKNLKKIIKNKLKK